MGTDNIILSLGGKLLFPLFNRFYHFEPVFFAFLYWDLKALKPVMGIEDKGVVLLGGST